MIIFALTQVELSLAHAFEHPVVVRGILDTDKVVRSDRDTRNSSPYDCCWVLVLLLPVIGYRHHLLERGLDIEILVVRLSGCAGRTVLEHGNVRVLVLLGHGTADDSLALVSVRPRLRPSGLSAMIVAHINL